MACAPGHIQIRRDTGTNWTKIASPAGDTPATGGGEPIGLLLALTYSGTPAVFNWSKIIKASGTSWTKITKAT